MPPKKTVTDSTNNNSTMDKPKRGRSKKEQIVELSIEEKKEPVIVEKSWSQIMEDSPKKNKIDDSSDESEDFTIIKNNKKYVDSESESSEENSDDDKMIKSIFETKTKNRYNSSKPFLKKEFKSNKPTSIADFDHDEYAKLDEDELCDYDTMDLLKVLMVRGINNNNPTLFAKAKSLLKELNFEEEPFNNRESRYGEDSFRGRGGYRGGFRGGSRFNNNNREQNVFEAGAGGGGDPKLFRRGGRGRGGFRA
jgi:hypothetical protein